MRRNADSTGGKRPAKQMTGLHGRKQMASYISPATAAAQQHQQTSEAAAASLSPIFLAFKGACSLSLYLSLITLTCSLTSFVLRSAVSVGYKHGTISQGGNEKEEKSEIILCVHERLREDVIWFQQMKLSRYEACP